MKKIILGLMLLMAAAPLGGCEGDTGSPRGPIIVLERLCLSGDRILRDTRDDSLSYVSASGWTANALAPDADLREVCA